MKNKSFTIQSVSEITGDDGQKTVQVRSSIVIEAFSEALALRKAQSMTLFERKRKNWDPRAGNKLVVLKDEKPADPAKSDSTGSGANPPAAKTATAKAEKAAKTTKKAASEGKLESKTGAKRGRKPSSQTTKTDSEANGRRAVN